MMSALGIAGIAVACLGLFALIVHFDRPIDSGSDPWSVDETDMDDE